MIYELETLILKNGAYAMCTGWTRGPGVDGRDRQRLTDKTARMLLCTEQRIVDIEPVDGRGESFSLPMENAIQWKAKTKPKGKRTSTPTGAETPAKAKVTSSAGLEG